MLKNKFYKTYYPFKSEEDVEVFLICNKKEVLRLLTTRKQDLISYLNRNTKMGYMRELEKIEEILAKLQEEQILSVDEANFVLEVTRRSALKNMVCFVILSILLVLLVATAFGWAWIFSTL